MKETELLNVYSASAGSGKTYTLALRFIDLLARNPQDYGKILAVTFTNKATAEMKSRILENLFLIAYEPNNSRQQKQRRRLIDAQLKLFAERGQEMDEQRLSKACETALILFLNNYSRFNISTIDSFVQHVIRAFAYEAGLSASYGIELDTKLVLQNAIDEIMLSIKTDEQLRKWLLSFVKNEMTQNSSWSIERHLKTLGDELFNDVDLSDLDTIEKKDIAVYRTFLLQTKKSFENEIRTIIGDIASTMNALGIESAHIKNGQKSPLWGLIKNQNSKDIGKILEKCEKIGNQSADELFKPDSPIFSKVDAVVKKIDNLINYFNEHKTDYFTAVEIEKNIYTIVVLSDIQRKIKEIARRDKTMPITDSHELLRALIGDSSVPFIYEKTGTQFKNIMIDEFQDTSHVQWDNFMPLIRNSLDTNNECLIVGDIKQAIYRWRNSDWRLLAYKVDQDFKNYVKRVNLQTNWRSCGNIINFNNQMFSSLREIVSVSVGLKVNKDRDEDILNVYNDCVQLLPDGKPENEGFISLKFTKEPPRGSSDEKGNQKKQRDSEVVDAIYRLHVEYAYSYSDICILVSTKKQGAEMITVLSDAGIPVISSDSLLVGNSAAVVAILSHMRYIANPSDKSALALAAVAAKQQPIENLVSAWDTMLKDYSDNILKLRGLGLIEMTDAIVRLMPEIVISEQQIFVEAFKEIVRNYTTTQHANLRDFITYFDERSYDMSIQAPENQYAVAIMTIHKSKGLQFKAVLMPYADWKIDKRSGFQKKILWAEMPAPFDVISPMPFLYSEALAHTYAAQLFTDEMRTRVVDSLNVLYVALTRAEEVLMTWSRVPTDFDPEKDVEYKSTTRISQYIYQAISLIADKCSFSSQAISGDTTEFTIGKIIGRADTQLEENQIKTYEITPTQAMPWSDRITIYRESEKSRFDTSHEIIAYGNMMHGIMERTLTLDDLHHSVQIAVQAGELNSADAQQVEHQIRKQITESEAARWFDGSMHKVYTEAEFVTSQGDSRPDRIMVDYRGSAVVVDYKFGETHKKSYEKQVQRYAELLKKAGFSDINGYIWYFNENEIAKVV